VYCIENFWAEMSVFGFDKAKEIADREKERALKTHVQTSQGSAGLASPPSNSSAGGGVGGGGGGGFTWVILTTAMAQLAVTEKAYVNLVFLAPKGFLRKDVCIRSCVVKLDGFASVVVLKLIFLYLECDHIV
jgi:hypothetical protein